jgi:hypothetical protein
MRVFCPYCLQNLKLKSRAPGQYSFKCPECSEQATVTVPEDPNEQVIARPIRSQRSTREPTSTKPPTPEDRPRGTPRGPAPEEAANQPRTFPVPESQRTTDGVAAAEAGRGSPLASQTDPKTKRTGRSGDNEQEQDRGSPHVASIVDDDVACEEWDLPEANPLPPLRTSVKKCKPKSKPKRRKKNADLSQFLAPMIFVGVTWVVLIAIAIIFRPAVYALLGLGSIVTLTGRRMFLKVAREEGLGAWLASLFIPFYSAYYFFTHLGETIRPFLIGCCGYVFLASGSLLWIVRAVEERRDVNTPDRQVADASDEEDADLPDQKAGEGLGQKAGLVLTVAGKEVSLPIEEMNYFHVKRGRDSFPDSFELSGSGSSIRGAFALGFEEDWERLVGKAVNILARSGEPEDGDSEINLPGRGMIKVTGGSFTVKKVISPRPSPVLRGRIRLETAGPHGPETLEGVFQVRVSGSY